MLFNVPTLRDRAAIYVRISADKTGEAKGVARQQTDCESLAARLALRVVRVYADNDVSAYSGRKRPAYLEMLEDIQAGEIDVVLAWHTDRLHRAPIELETYVRLLEEHKVTTHTVTTGEIDLSTASGRMHARQLGTLARYESEHKSERISRKMLEKAMSGEYHGGTVRPFGFEPDGITHRPDEADEIRKMSDALIAGESIGSIIRDLNSRGIKSVRGNEWRYVTVRALLLRARNAGLRIHQSEVIGKAVWEPIISPSKLAMVERILFDPSRRTTKNSGRRHLLSGVAKCGVCGKGMKSGGSKTRYGTPFKVYRCCTTRNMDKLDSFIEHLAIRVLGNQPWDRESPSEDVSGLKKEIDEIENEMVESAKSRAAGKITLAQLEAMNDSYNERLAALHERLADASPVPAGIFVGVPNDVDFRSLSRDRQRTIIKAMFDIWVMPIGKGSNKRGVTLEDGLDVTPIGEFVHGHSNLDEALMAIRFTPQQGRQILRALGDVQHHAARSEATAFGHPNSTTVIPSALA